MRLSVEAVICWRVDVYCDGLLPVEADWMSWSAEAIAGEAMSAGVSNSSGIGECGDGGLGLGLNGSLVEDWSLLQEMTFKSTTVNRLQGNKHVGVGWREL